MKTISLACIFFLFAWVVNAQVPTFSWANQTGGSNTDAIQSLAIDSSSNVYTIGVFQDTIDVDPGLGVQSFVANGIFNIFIQKFSPAGNLLWAKQIPGVLPDATGPFISVDRAGHVLATGFFQDTIDINPGTGVETLISNGSFDAFFLKLDANGDFVWARQIGGNGQDAATFIGTDSAGNVYTTGFFQGTADLDPGPGVQSFNVAGGTDAFFIKLDPNGTLTWVKHIGAMATDYPFTGTVDPQGNLHVAGIFQDRVDFDPGPGTAFRQALTSGSFFLQKLDPNGNFLWVGQYDGPQLFSLTTDQHGNVYSTGSFRGNSVFDAGSGNVSLTSTGLDDGFVDKRDSSGNFIWVKQLSATRGAEVFSITEQDAALYLAGVFVGTLDTDPGTAVDTLTSVGGEDIFIEKLDLDGNLLWSAQVGGTADDGSLGIVADAEGNIYTAGFFRDSVDLDPGVGVVPLFSLGATDGFLLKLGECFPSFGTDIQTACDAYIWLDGTTYTTSNSSATVVFRGAAANGCDSIVSLDLTINQVSNLNTSVMAQTITASNPNASYQWLDCNDNFRPIPGEINQQFTATVNGSYAVELTENGCVDTSACVAITNVNLDRPGTPSGIRLFPNPSNGRLTISLPHPTSDINVQVHDLQGRLIYTEKYQPTDLVELTLEAPNGIYSITLATNEWTESMTFLKE